MPKCWNILTDSFWVVHQNLPKFQKLNFDENISEKLITYELWVQQHQFLEIFNKMSKRALQLHNWTKLEIDAVILRLRVELAVPDSHLASLAGLLARPLVDLARWSFFEDVCTFPVGPL